MKLFELRHEGPPVHPYEIRDPRSRKELRAGVLPQRMNVNIIEDIRNGISYSLVAGVLVSK